MIRRMIACLVITASLAVASPALAHNPVGSAEQACVEDEIVLAASFVNEGYEGTTSVTATDSQAGDLGIGTSPATFESTFPGPSRDAGTVTFAWEADNGHNGSVSADYGAVVDCEKPQPPPPPPPDDNDNPPDDTTNIGGPNPPNGEGPPEQPPVAPGPPAPAPDTLPYTGLPLLLMGIVGATLLGGGRALWRKTR